MSDKIYVGSFKEKSGQFGSFIDASFSVEELLNMAKNHANERGYVNLTISRRKEPSEHGHTHKATINTWRPNQQAPKSSGELSPTFDDSDDIPWS